MLRPPWGVLVSSWPPADAAALNARQAGLALLVLTTVACSEVDPGETGSGGDSTGGTDTGTTTGVGGGDYGFVKLEMQRSAAAQFDPFAGTDSIVATLAYGTCLDDLYDANPDLGADGPEGGPVFTEWVDILCDGSLSAEAPCSVTEITQTLAGGAFLTVEFTTPDASQLEGMQLKFGPLPTDSLAGCGSAPTVEAQINSLVGFDGPTAVWTVEAFDPSQVATGASTPITFSIGRI